MASRRSHAASHNITSISTRYKITYYSRVPRGHVYIRNPLQAAKQRSCGYERQPLPTTVPRSGTDTVTMILRTVHRSRFAEPRESVSVFAYPQRRSFGACSGFLIDTCPIGTRRCSYCHTVTEVASGKKLRITVSLRSTTKEPQAAEQA